MAKKGYGALLLMFPLGRRAKADPDEYTVYSVDQAHLDEEGALDDGSIDGSDVSEEDEGTAAEIFGQAITAWASGGEGCPGARPYGALPSAPNTVIMAPPVQAGAQTTAATGNEILAYSRAKLEAARIPDNSLFQFGPGPESNSVVVFARRGALIQRQANPDQVAREFGPNWQSQIRYYPWATMDGILISQGPN